MSEELTEHKKEVLRTGAKKRAIKKRYGNQCIYCGCTNKMILTIDHTVPLARGGSDDDKNKASVCFVCNQLKGALTEKEFRKYLKALYSMWDLCKVNIKLSQFSIQFNHSFYPINKEEKKEANQ